MSGFPKGVENMGGLSQYMRGAWGGGLKCCQKIPVMDLFDSKSAGYKPASL